MALVPRLLRPSVVIRNKALYSGFLGASRFWKFVGLFVFGRRALTRFFGRRPEVVEVSKLGPGHVLQIVTATPMTKRRRRRLAKRGILVPGLAVQRRLARAWADEQAARVAS